MNHDQFDHVVRAAGAVLGEDTPFAGILSPRERWAVYRARAA